MRTVSAKRRFLSALTILLLALAYLAGCAPQEPPPPPHEGTWYFANNAVECRIGDGKIYEDDLNDREGQSLRGVYAEMDGYIQAHLAGTGGVEIPRDLYVVQTDAGEVLCDSADGNGVIYFYRDALAAMAALEAAEPAPAQSDTPELPSAPAVQAPVESADPSPEPSSRSMPTSEEEASPEPRSTQTISTSGDMVWIPQSGSKYHRSSSCSGMQDPSQVTKDEAERRGYTPCKRCY